MIHELVSYVIYDMVYKLLWDLKAKTIYTINSYIKLKFKS